MYFSTPQIGCNLYLGPFYCWADELFLPIGQASFAVFSPTLILPSARWEPCIDASHYQIFLNGSPVERGLLLGHLHKHLGQTSNCAPVLPVWVRNSGRSVRVPRQHPMPCRNVAWTRRWARAGSLTCHCGHHRQWRSGVQESHPAPSATPSWTAKTTISRSGNIYVW